MCKDLKRFNLIEQIEKLRGFFVSEYRKWSFKMLKRELKLRRYLRKVGA